MKVNEYIKEKFPYIVLYVLQIVLIAIFLYMFHMNYPIIIIISGTQVVVGICILGISYARKQAFYNTLLTRMEFLDKKYYVLETMPMPHTYEEKIVCDVLYDINKSMIDTIKQLEYNQKDYIEFIEMWIHEVKIPISSLLLKCHNNPSLYDSEFLSLLHRLDNYVEQVLYYARGENAEKDYSISNVSLYEILHKAIMNNKEDLLDNGIEIELCCDEEIVYTDSKWMIFIINQILNNSIKYKKDKDAKIKISVETKDKDVYLHILDNGIGISERDLKNVFNKSFTGENGRIKKATGMGLYIVHNMCQKLGHSVSIASKKNEYTEVTIVFGNHDYYTF